MPRLRNRGIDHHYQLLGRQNSSRVRTPAVFIHGLVMDNLSSWYLSIASPIAQETQALLYDLRGHGLSERPPSGYSMQDFVDDLAVLVDAVFGSTPVCLISNSFGAAIGIEYTLREPARVAGMVLLDGHLGADDFQSKMLHTLRLRGAAAEAVATELLRDWHARNSPRKRESIIRNARALLEGTTLVADLSQKAPLSKADFARIEVPTLALYGEHSDALAASRPLLASMPNCTLEVLDGCGHILLAEALASVRSRVVEFCQRQEVCA